VGNAGRKKAGDFKEKQIKDCPKWGRRANTGVEARSLEEEETLLESAVRGGGVARVRCHPGGKIIKRAEKDNLFLLEGRAGCGIDGRPVVC